MGKKKNNGEFFKNETTLRELSDSIRKSNIRMTGALEGEEREMGTESIFKEIISENILDLWKGLDPQKSRH